MVISRAWRTYRRKVSKERRLEFLGRLWARYCAAGRRAVRFGADEFGESAADVGRLAKFAQAGRILRRLADQAALQPYVACEPPSDRQADHTALPEGLAAREGREPLWAVVDKLLKHLNERDRRIIEWRFGVHCQDRLTCEEIAHRLGCDVRTVERHTQSALEILSAYAISG